jgi:hypothetical protein
VTLPVSEISKVLFGAGWAEVAGLPFVDAVAWVVRIEGQGVWNATCLGIGAGFAVEFGG